MGLSKAILYEFLHNRVYIISVHLNTNFVHECNKTNSEETTVHPVFIILGSLGYGRDGTISLPPKSLGDIILALSGNPSLKFGGLSADLSLVKSTALEKGRSDFLLGSLLRVVLQQKIKSRNHTKRPDGVTYETSIYNGEMGGSYNVSHHVLVKSIDGLSEDLGEFSECLSNSLYLNSLKVLETFSESSLGGTGLVVGSSGNSGLNIIKKSGI
mmetsp:Transcript_7957/g.11842  ORF Transcript_7957/g.11842 Transcript_7957/m.11842 type:complete len:213 (+) Transcript_7957:452-1090(+)